MQNDLQQREQEHVATADIVVIVKNLEKSKRQNTALDLHIENSMEPTVDETELRPTDVVQKQCDHNLLDESFVVTTTLRENALETYGLSTDFMSKHTKDEVIEELKRKLDELEKAYMDKKRWYQKAIAKLDTEMREDEKFRKKIYKSSMEVKSKISVLYIIRHNYSDLRIRMH
jgi:phosphomevalonate kinase